MLIKTAEAARLLGIHPSQLFISLKEIGQTLVFEEIWPSVDKAWIETIAISKGKFIPEIAHFSEENNHQITQAKSEGLSDRAIRVLNILRLHNKWGHASISFEALMNLAHLSSQDLRVSIIELKGFDCIDHDSEKKGNISLNPNKSLEIRSILQNK